MVVSASLSEVDMCVSSSRTLFSWSMVVLRSAMTSLCAPSSDCVVACADRLTSVDTASATAVTKVELICSSISVAPVSVIFGAIAFSFSLT